MRYMKLFYAKGWRPDARGMRRRASRYLGPMLTNDFTLKTEREARISAARRAYMMFGRLWKSNAPLGGEEGGLRGIHVEHAT